MKGSPEPDAVTGGGAATVQNGPLPRHLFRSQVETEGIPNQCGRQMRTLPIVLLAVLTLSGCHRESDADVLKRLETAREAACRPVVAADSAEHAHDAALARLGLIRQGASPYGEGEQAIKRIRADQAEAQQSIADLESKARMTQPEKDTAAAQRVRCALAERNYRAFLNGGL
jgi:hypothetical protein